MILLHLENKFASQLMVGVGVKCSVLALFKNSEELGSGVNLCVELKVDSKVNLTVNLEMNLEVNIELS